jgi:hypothetical protein
LCWTIYTHYYIYAHIRVHKRKNSKSAYHCTFIYVKCYWSSVGTSCTSVTTTTSTFANKYVFIGSKTLFKKLFFKIQFISCFCGERVKRHSILKGEQLKSGMQGVYVEMITVRNVKYSSLNIDKVYEERLH